MSRTSRPTRGWRQTWWNGRATRRRARGGTLGLTLALSLSLSLTLTLTLALTRWHSFGFNEKEGWREEGFSVAFAPEERQVRVRVRVRVRVGVRVRG